MFCLVFFLTPFCVTIYLFFRRYSRFSCRLTFWHRVRFVSRMNIVSVFFITVSMLVRKVFTFAKVKSADSRSQQKNKQEVCVATCCVLLKPVEFVRELFPAYSPDVVVKVPPWREKDLFTYIHNWWWLLKAKDGKKWHIVVRKILSFSGKKNCSWWTEGGLRECSQEWPYLSPLPPLSLIGSGLMNDGGG